MLTYARFMGVYMFNILKIIIFAFITLSSLLFSCDGTTMFDSDDDNVAFDITAVRAMTGGQNQSSVVLEFSDAVQSIDMDYVKVKKNDQELIPKGAFFRENDVYITVKDSIEKDDAISMTITPGAVMSVSGKTNNPQNKNAVAEPSPPNIIDTISVPNSRHIYLVYDGLVSWANKLQYELSSGNTVTEAKVITDITSHTEQALVSNKYISEEKGISAASFSNYIVQITVAKPISASDSISLTAKEGAATSIDGQTLSEIANNISISKIDDIFPELVRIEASSAHDTRIILVFDEIITSIKKERIEITINNDVNNDFTANINADNKREIYIILDRGHAVRDTLVVQIGAGAVQNSEGNDNASSTNTTQVADTTGPILQSITANNGGSSANIVVSFDEEIALSDAEKFLVTVAGKPVVVQSASIDSTEKIKVNLTLSASFQVGDEIRVLLEKEAVTDMANPIANSNIADDVGKITTVFDSSLPLLQSIAASDASPLLVTAIFNRIISTVDPQKFHITVNNTAVGITKAEIDEQNSQKILLSIDTSLTRDDTVQVTLDADAVSDTNVTGEVHKNVADANGQSVKVIDQTPPRVLSISATDKPEIIIEFSEAIRVIAKEQFVVKDASVNVALKDVEVRNNTKVSLIAEESIPYTRASILSISIESGAVQDAADNNNISDASTGKQIVVQDITPPFLKTVIANDGNNTQNQLVLEFNEELSRISTATIDFTVKIGTRSYAIKTAALGNVPTKVALTLAKDIRLTKNEYVTVTLGAGAVVDNARNESITDTTGIRVAVNDVTAPQLESVVANDGDNSKTQLMLTFSEEISSVTGSYFTVKVGTRSYAVQKATLAANKFGVELLLVDGSRLPKGSTVTVDMAVGAVVDTATPGYKNEQDSVTATVTDVTAPELASIIANDGPNTQTQIILELSEELTTISTRISDFVVKEGDKALSVQTVELDSRNKKEIHITLAEPSRLTKDSTVTVTLASGSITDAEGNASTTILSGSSEAVRDVTPPVLQTVKANDANKKQVVVYFNEGVRILQENNFLVNNVAAAEARTVKDGEVILTLNADFTGSIVRVTLAEGAVTDITGNESTSFTTGIVALVVDVTPPTLKTVTANDGDNSQAQLVLEFSEDITTVSNVSNDFIVKVGTTIYPVKRATLATIKTNINLYLVDDSRLPKDSSVVLTLAEGAVADAKNNENVALTSGVVATVQDITPPSLKAVIANDGPNTQTQIILELSEELTTISTRIGDFVVKEEDIELSVQTAKIDSGNKKEIHITLAEPLRLTRDSTVTVILASGSITDTKGNASSTILSETSAPVSDVTPPTLKTVVANDGPNTQTQIILELSEELTTISTRISDFVVKEGNKALSIQAAKLDSRNKKEIHITLAEPSRLTKDSTVTVTLASGSITDTKGNASSTILSGSSAPVSDVTPPTLKTVVANDGPNTQTQIILELSEELTTISTRISDFVVKEGNKALSIQTAKLDSRNKKEIHITLAEPLRLTRDSIVTVTLASGSITDTKGNASSTILSGSSAPVSDVTPPVLQTVKANDANKKQVVAYFNEGVRILQENNFLVNNVAASAARTVKDGEVILTLNADFTGSIVRVTLAEGAVADITGNKNTSSTTGIVAPVADVTLPSLKTVTANDGDNSQVQLVLEFSEDIATVSNVTNDFIVKVGTTTYPVKRATLATIKTNINLYLVDDSRLPKDSSVGLTLAEGAVADITGNKNTSSTTGIVATVRDVTPPSLKTVVANDGPNTQTQIILELSEELTTISTRISDFVVKEGNKALSIQTAKLDSSNKKEIHITLAEPLRLTRDSIVTVTLASGSITDTKGNASSTILSESSAPVSDVTPPVLQTVKANDGPNTQTQIILELSEELTTISTRISDFVVKEGNKTLSVQTAKLDSKNKKEIHITLAEPLRLTRDSTVTVTLASGSITDTKGNASSTILSESSAPVSDITPPSLKRIIADDGENNQDQLVLEFDEEISHVSSTLTNFIVKIGTTSYTVKTANPDTDKKKINLRLADGSRLIVGSTVNVTLKEGAVTDASGNTNTILVSGIESAVIDITKPFIQKITANDGDNSQDQLVLEFNEKLANVSNSMADFTVKIGSTRYGVKTAILDSNKNAVKLKLLDNSRLTATSTVNIALAPGVVTDNSGNTSDSISQTISVVDITPPSLKRIIADDGENNQDQLVLEFDEEISHVSSTLTNFIVKIGTTSYTVKTANPDTDKKKINLRLADGSRLIVGSTVNVTLKEGAVTDASGNTNAILTSGIESAVIDITRPTITSVRANNGKPKQVEVTFSEEVIVVQSAYFKVNNGAVSGAVTSGGSASRTVTLTTTEFSVNDVLRITMSAGAVKDGGNNMNEVLGTATTASTTTVTDGQPPLLTSIRIDNSSEIVMGFNENVQFPDASKFVVKSGTNNISLSNPVIQNSKEVKLQALLTGNGGSTVRVSLLAGAVKDSSNNQNLADPTGLETAYRIITAEVELGFIADAPTAKYKLLNNITLENTYDQSVVLKPFSGEFDGNGYKIINFNLDISSPGDEKYAFFSNLETNAIIKNLTIAIGSVFKSVSQGAWTKISPFVAGIESSNKNIEINNVHIVNPNNTEYEQKGNYELIFGGLIAEMYAETAVKIIKSSVTGIKTKSAEGPVRFGGFIGLARGRIIVQESYVKDVVLRAKFSAGGIIGRYPSDYVLTMTDSYVIADLYAGTSTAGSNIGIIIGDRDGSTSSTTLSRVWVESTDNNTKLSDNVNVTSTTHVYSNVARGSGTGSAAQHILSGTTLPTGFSSTIWEIKSPGARPTLKNNPE